MITFTKVSLPYGWLGNMSPYQVDYDGKSYRTTEHLFQCLRFHDYPEVQEQIRLEKSPMVAKMKAKSFHHLLIADGYVFREDEDILYMILCLKLKLEQHPNIKTWLLETDDELIIEDCTKRHDTFWGARLVNNEWHGENVIGVLWMELRDELRRGIANGEG